MKPAAIALSLTSLAIFLGAITWASVFVQFDTVVDRVVKGPVETIVASKVNILGWPLSQHSRNWERVGDEGKGIETIESGPVTFDGERDGEWQVYHGDLSERSNSTVWYRKGKEIRREVWDQRKQ